jgi:hypothetical protein
MLDDHQYSKHQLMKVVEMPYFVRYHIHVVDLSVAAVVVEEVTELFANWD